MLIAAGRVGPRVLRWLIWRRLAAEFRPLAVGIVIAIATKGKYYLRCTDDGRPTHARPAW